MNELNCLQCEYIEPIAITSTPIHLKRNWKLKFVRLFCVDENCQVQVQGGKLFECRTNASGMPCNPIAHSRQILSGYIQSYANACVRSSTGARRCVWLCASVWTLIHLISFCRFVQNYPRWVTMTHLSQNKSRSLEGGDFHLFCSSFSLSPSHSVSFGDARSIIENDRQHVSGCHEKLQNFVRLTQFPNSMLLGLLDQYSAQFYHVRESCTKSRNSVSNVRTWFTAIRNWMKSAYLSLLPSSAITIVKSILTCLHRVWEIRIGEWVWWANTYIYISSVHSIFGRDELNGCAWEWNANSSLCCLVDTYWHHHRLIQIENERVFALN